MAADLWSVDLHSHSVFSDGSLTPAELVRLASTNGVRVLSLTDHDHTGGIDAALEAGNAAGIEVIPGIELSVSYAEFEDIHLLAYYFAWHDAHLRARLESFRIARETRAERILERINVKLAEEGREPIVYHRVKAQVQGAFGRPHIATALIDRGYVPDMNAAFKAYLIPCNVPKYSLPADEAFALIGQARGLSSVAHPRFITSDRARLRQVVQDFRAYGLDGVEAYHNDHDAEARQYFIQLANQLGMIVTGGSDYHGFKAQGSQHDSGGKLGSLQLPYGVAVRLRRAYGERYPLLLLLLHWPSAASTALRRALATHYHLASMATSPLPAVAPAPGRVEPEGGSIVVDLPAADRARLDAFVAAARERGRRVVGLPWDTTKIDAPDGFYQTGRVSSERFRRTPIERLAHELVHEAILVQLQ